MNSATKLVLASVCILVATSIAQSDTLTPNNDTALKQLDHANLKQLPIGLPIDISNLELEKGLNVNLHIKRFELLTQDAKVVVVKANGHTDFINPSVVLLRGKVIGDDDSMVFIGVSNNSTHGFVQHNNLLHFISTGPYRKNFQSQLALQIANAASLPAPASAKDFCQTQLDNDWLFPFGKPIQEGIIPLTGNPPCRNLELAIDTDWEFTGLFAGSTTASANYALMLAGAMSEIFQRDLNTKINVSFLRVWSENNDPYDANSAGEALNELRDHWNENQSYVHRDMVHLFSGKNLGGGVAWVSVLCNYNYAYAASGNLNGSFPYPLQDNVGGNWDPFIVAHETGHNCGTLHTHDGYVPPLDGCGNGDCSNANQGTIMSYCHICTGGMTNIALKYHPVVIEKILGFFDGVACDISSDHCCDWDLDESGNVDTNDLLLLFSQWGTNPEGPPDFDGDGIVNTTDLLILFANWGLCEE